jgi:hypothetical protein
VFAALVLAPIIIRSHSIEIGARLPCCHSEASSSAPRPIAVAARDTSLSRQRPWTFALIRENRSSAPDAR